MICGNCKKDHETVQQVKDCYGTRIATLVVFSATTPQMKYIKALLAERQMSPLPEGTILSKVEASEMINALRQIPKPVDPGRQSADGDPEGYGDPDPSVLFTDGEDFTISRMQAKLAMDDPRSAFHTSPQAAAWTMPAGYYAIKSISGTNDLDFYRVDRPAEGKWAGYTFVKMVIGGKSDSRVYGKKRMFDILSEIEKNADAAALKYAQEIGNCSRCNRHLTDETSRKYGMGPECRSKANAA